MSTDPKVYCLTDKKKVVPSGGKFESFKGKGGTVRYRYFGFCPTCGRKISSIVSADTCKAGKKGG